MQPTISFMPLWAQLILAIIPALGTFFAAIGLLLNVQQSRRTNAQARASLVASCLKGFADDPEIQKAFHVIDYDNFFWDGNFQDSDQEHHIDKILRHFANIALAWQAGLLSTSDIKPVQYYILRVTCNKHIQDYLKHIDKLSKNYNQGEHPFAVLNRLSTKLLEQQ